MNRFKKITKIVIGFFFLVSSTISFNYEPVYQSIVEISITELLTSVEDVASAVEYDIAKKLLISSSTKPEISKSNRLVRLQDLRDNSLLEYKIQNNHLLNYKSILLNVVLNDIVQQKSHWI